jgi:translation initiation factor 4G
MNQGAYQARPIQTPRPVPPTRSSGPPSGNVSPVIPVPLVTPATPAFTLPVPGARVIKISDPSTGKSLDLASIKESIKKDTDRPAEKTVQPEKEHVEKPVEKPASPVPPKSPEVTLPVRESKAIPIRRPDETPEPKSSSERSKAPSPEASPEPKAPSRVETPQPDSRAETPEDLQDEPEEGYEFEIESEGEYLDDTVPDVDVDEEATEDFQDELAAKLSSLHVQDSKPTQVLDPEVVTEVSPTAAYKARPPELKKLDTKQVGPAVDIPIKMYIKPSTFDDVEYPANVTKPFKTKNIFKYDVDFLMKFLSVENWDYPAGMPSHESIFEDTPSTARSPTTGTPTGRGRGMLPRTGSMRTPSATDLSSPTVRSGLTNAAKMSNEERFAAHMSKVRATGLAPSRSSVLGQGGRNYSSEGLGPRQASGSKTARGKGRGAPKSRKELEMEKQFTIPEDQIKPLEMSESAWVAQLRKQQEDKDLDEEAKHRLLEESTRKDLQGLLNKLTLDKFERLSDQIIALDVSSPSQLKLVIYGVYDKAVDEPNFGPMYARLCAKMSAKLPELHKWIAMEGEEKNNLFRRILLNKCQEEFERGSKWAEIGANRPAIDPQTLSVEERQALADEDDLRFKLKRRSLGNIKFIGELFKLGMLTEKIMHSCITSLLMDGVKAYIKNDNEENREGAEEELESLCKLLATVGQKLDHPKAAKIMDAYFGEMLKLSEVQSVPSRIRFALQDVVDLRDDKWQARTNIVPTGPKTIAEIRKEAEKAQEQSKLGPRQGSRGMGPPQFSGTGPRNPSGMGGRQDSRIKDNWSKDSKKGSSSNLAKGFKESDRISPANGQRAPSPNALSRTPSNQPARAATPSTSSNMFSALEGVKDDHDAPKLDREKAERRIENMIAEWFASQSYDVCILRGETNILRNFLPHGKSLVVANTMTTLWINS